MIPKARLTLSRPAHADLRQRALDRRAAQTRDPVRRERAVPLRQQVKAVDEDLVDLHAADGLRGGAVVGVGAVGRVGDVEHDRAALVAGGGKRGVAAEEDGAGGVVPIDEGCGERDDGEGEARGVGGEVGVVEVRAVVPVQLHGVLVVIPCYEEIHLSGWLNLWPKR